MNEKNFLHRATKALIEIMFYGGILFCLSIPFSVPPLARALGYSQDLVVPYSIVLTLSGACALFILWQLKAIFKTLLGGNPFTSGNVGALRKCAVASLLIAIIYSIKICLWFTIASSIIVIIFSLLGLFCLTLKDVFKQAVAYKEENDWTV
ncbi:MAG: DUF2975 domain-containing protein [Oscillospiraceae bacterium]|nr:DUF2975 domain-containing protein [Oscillospiraceae bacterium]